MVAAKKVWTYFVVALIAFVVAVNYELFIFPNSFAPSGINGICTMIQHVFGISVGYLSLLVNIPLAIWCYIEVSKPVALRSMVYVGVFSVALLILDHVDLSAFAYSTENGTSKILGPLVAGIIMGYCYNLLMRSSAYSGGTDFISAIIHKRNPNKSVMGITFILNAIVAVGSYFVYDFQMEPVILCIIYSFASTTVGERLTKSGREAIRFEIVTDHPEELAEDIIHKLHHSATLIPAKGMYLGRETNILICVVNKTQIAALSAVIRKYPNTFAVMSSVSEVMGNFKHVTNDGKIEKQFLDQGDGQAV